ncbi:ribosomal protein S18-alanine N-acetyltransferase [Pseudidiomarina salinarum]|uniref:ribosomal protein S18-alanine N-acetyltransferase n=1 Tax=Pseudidiomarina salinarum TaxID=435908 RepID=UPI00068A684A|nr:ribosomal protein S18-alanine N-acetyltransferase [Pseudidiomarina salinarum]RUO68264.1 ribosomal-protein-alanine N-acetyltransferase [Pseudidiomarina salinarum]
MAADQSVIGPLGWSAAVCELEQKASPHPWSEAALYSCFNDDYQNWALRTSDGVLAGYIITQQVADELTIMNIAVHPDYRRRGYAGQLINWVQGMAAREGYTLWLEVRRSNTPAIALYQRTGFSEVGVRKGYYPTATGAEDALVMRWSSSSDNQCKTCL